MKMMKRLMVAQLVKGDGKNWLSFLMFLSNFTQHTFRFHLLLCAYLSLKGDIKVVKVSQSFYINFMSGFIR